MKVHLFNPGNDAAMATDSACYTLPRNAAAIEECGELLPLWWASDGDVVISRRPDDAAYIKDRYGLKARVESHLSPTESRAITCAQPWGWSRDARRRLEQAGVPTDKLPTEAQLAEMRRLSHRRLTIRINDELKRLNPSIAFPPTPREVVSISEIMPSDYVKLPWSSSGRGVFQMPQTGMDSKLAQQIEGMIRRQGSVMTEKPFTDKAADFAALFYSDGDGVSFRGLSLFYTGRDGAYTGNVIAAEETLREMLGDIADRATVDKITDSLELILSDIVAPHYRGWLGIDMMAANDGRIAPCVEMNLRMTMGVVAHLLRNHPSIKPMMPAKYVVTTDSVPKGALHLTPPGRFNFAVV